MLFCHLDPPPINYILTLVKPFSFVWYVIPLLETGAFDSTSNLFQRVDNKKHRKKPRSHVPFMLLAAILARWWHPVASSEALDLLHWAICAVLYRCTAAAIETASFVGIFVDCCLFACCTGVRWGNTEWVVSPPMVASSGLQSSPGHAASGNAVCIPLAHRRGHQNGQRMRYIRSSLPTFSLTLFVAKDHVMVK